MKKHLVPIVLTLLLGALFVIASVPMESTTAEAAVATASFDQELKRKAQNKARRTARKECKNTNATLERGRPVKTLIWASNCVDYSQARKIRCWESAGPSFHPGYITVNCTPSMAWTVQVNLPGADPFKIKPACWNKEQTWAGVGISAHFHYQWFRGNGRWVHKARMVTQCNYFKYGVRA